MIRKSATILYLTISCSHSGYEWNAAKVDVLLKLELYDMVDFSKNKDSAGNELWNHFQGWLIQ